MAWGTSFNSVPLQSQITWSREQLQREVRISHDQIFFNADGTPIRRLREPCKRWHRTLRRLSIRYRKPYAARHSSVSWILMSGRNPLWVAKRIV